MEEVIKTDPPNPSQDEDAIAQPVGNLVPNQPSMSKRKHRRGKPKSKTGNKTFKKTNWKFQMPRVNHQANFGNGAGMNRRNNRSRMKLERSQSLVPYNTNKFLMEEHLADVPLLTPGRTRDSSFSVDSEDNYFFSLPEDEEEFLTKEFANVYEKARVERLENLSKEQLIEEFLQIEDRYSNNQDTQQQMTVQRISAEFMSKIRFLEEKVKELTRENYNLRCQLVRSATLAAAAAASPPSAAAPVGACQPTPMDSSSEDSESDSSSSSSSSTSQDSFSSRSCASDAEHGDLLQTPSPHMDDDSNESGDTRDIDGIGAETSNN